MKYDAVVIGSGISGMSAALVLAKHGRKVALLEQHKRLAPLIRRFKRGDCWCDVGFHYAGGFAPGGSLGPLLRYLGVGGWRAEPMDADGFDVFNFDGLEFAFPAGLERVRQALKDAFKEATGAVDAYINKVERLLKTTPFLGFGPEAEDFTSAGGSGEGLWAFLDAHGASPALKNLLGNYSLMLCGVPGEEITFYMHTMVVGPFLQGACTLARGGDDMVSGFEGALAAAGVDTFTSRAATGLEIDGSRKLKGVRAADGEVLETPLCVCTIHPQLLQGLMPKDAVRPAYLSRLRDLRNTGGALALFLDIPGVPAAFVRRNRYFCYKEDNGSQAVLAVMASEPEAIPRKAVCVLRSLDLRNLPAGDYGGRKVPGPYRDYKQAQVARTLAMMESMAPDLRGRYKVLDAATPLTFERYTGTVNGCAYGILRGPDQIPLNPVTSVRGFYLAGQSILFPGLLGTVISGILAGQHILDMQTIWKEVKQAWRSNGSL